MPRASTVWLARVALVGGGLFFAEIALQAASFLSPVAAQRLSGLKPRYVADPALDVRGDPSSPEYDDAGFRNAERPARAGVVVIGDSQTEGSGVARDHAWPQRLASVLATDVYQMAFGSYGPGHYLALVDDALALEPATLIVALYTGNDLPNVYEWVYEKGRNTELRTSVPETLAALATAERERGAIDATWRATRDAEKGLAGRPILRWLRTHVEQKSKLIALYDQMHWRMSGRGSRLDADAGQSDWDEVTKITSGVPQELLFAYDDGAARTVFTPSARLAALDLDDPRIGEALRLTLAMLERIAERVAGKADLAVVVIPTKESVYAPRVIQRSSDVPRAFTELIAAENAVRARITELLDARGIPWVDALPAMRRALDVQPERPLYPEGWDGHPAPAGHEAIASAVATLQPRDTRSNAATPRSSDPEASAARLSGRSS